jgi:uncharacterized GH25 family protein
MYLKKLGLMGLLVILGVVFYASSVYACHPWINANKYKLRVNNTIRFHIAYGHNYPFGHSFYSNDRIENLYLLNPTGEKKEVGPRVLGKGKLSQVQFESKENLEPGTYLLVMETKGSFFAYTSKGYKRKSKTELKGKEIKGDVLFSRNYCKALVNVGGKSGGETYSKVLGHGLEIVPLKDPSGLAPMIF